MTFCKMLSIVAVLAAAHLAAPEARAGRVVHFEVLVDGKLVLQGSRLDRGEAAPDAAWEYLKALPLETPDRAFIPEKERPAAGFAVAPDKDDPLKATLAGKVRVFCRYAGDVTVESLKLVRDKADSKKWRLDPAEVERLAKLRQVDPKSGVRQ